MPKKPVQMIEMFISVLNQVYLNKICVKYLFLCLIGFSYYSRTTQIFYK